MANTNEYNFRNNLQWEEWGMVNKIAKIACATFLIPLLQNEINFNTYLFILLF